MFDGIRSHLQAELAKNEMGKLTGGLNLPFKLPF